MHRDILIVSMGTFIYPSNTSHRNGGDEKDDRTYREMAIECGRLLTRVRLHQSVQSAALLMLAKWLGSKRVLADLFESAGKHC